MLSSSDEDFVFGGFTKSVVSFFEHVHDFLPFLNYSVISLGFHNIFSSFWRLTKSIKTTVGRNNTVLLCTCAPLYIVYFDSGLLLRSVKLKSIHFSFNYSHLEKVFTQFQLRLDIKNWIMPLYAANSEISRQLSPVSCHLGVACLPPIW